MSKERRRRSGNKRRKIVNNYELRRKIIGYLKDKSVEYSPDVIAHKINE
jgi:hypothetical protein